jgi:hypothetical protein
VASHGTQGPHSSLRSLIVQLPHKKVQSLILHLLSVRVQVRGEALLLLSLDAQQLVGCCQTNSNQSQFTAERVNLSGTKLTPLGESGASV